MPVMDEFREEREALKNGTPKQKLSYFWLYYKWYVIGGVAAIFLLVTLIHDIVTQKEDAFLGVFVNAWPQEGSEEYLQEFAENAGINAEKYSVSADSSLYYNEGTMDETSMAAIQKLAVYVAAGEIDVMVSDPDTTRRYANGETFADLREVLSEEQLEKYEPYFYYIDMKVVADVEEHFDEHIMEEDYVPVYPDPTKPEEMEQPVPVGVYISDCQEFLDRYIFSDETVILGIIINSQHQDNAIAFLEYVFGN